MEKYKPQYLGKVMPEDPPKLTAFMQKNFEQFSKAYDTCKGQSKDIGDIKNITTAGASDTLSVKISAPKAAIDAIAEKVTAIKDPEVTISGNTVTITPA